MKKSRSSRRAKRVTVDSRRETHDPGPTTRPGTHDQTRDPRPDQGPTTRDQGTKGQSKISFVKTALVQQHASADKSENIRRGLNAVDHAAAQGANVVVFAELAFERFHPQRPADGDPLRLAEPVPGPLTDIFVERARRHGLVIVLNLYERDRRHAYDCS